MFLKAFNWKEKKILGISSEKKKDFKLRPYGNLDDIKDFLQTDDVVSPFDGKDKSFDQADLADAIIPESPKKVINVASLYGSKKVAGLLLKKQKPEIRPRFSIGLIFGERHRKIAEEKRLKSAAEAETNTVRQ
jgi:hypothetical protein